MKGLSVVIGLLCLEVAVFNLSKKNDERFLISGLETAKKPRK
jgi:hypothetical protein